MASGTPSEPYEPPSGRYSHTPSDRRWTDSAKVVWALIGAIALVIMSWGGVVYTTAHGAEVKNVEQDVRIQSLEAKFERIDLKQDRILERLPK